MPEKSEPAVPEDRAEDSEVAGRRIRGVIVDWGGVMTSPISDIMNAWLDADGIDRNSFAAAIRPWLKQAYTPDGDDSPVHALERGADRMPDLILAGRR